MLVISIGLTIAAYGSNVTQILGVTKNPSFYSLAITSRTSSALKVYPYTTLVLHVG